MTERQHLGLRISRATDTTMPTRWKAPPKPRLKIGRRHPRTRGPRVPVHSNRGVEFVAAPAGERCDDLSSLNAILWGSRPVGSLPE